MEDVNSEDNNNNHNKQQSRELGKEERDDLPHAPRIMKGRRDREDGKERAKRSQSAHSLGQRNPLPSEDGANTRYDWRCCC